MTTMKRRKRRGPSKPAPETIRATVSDEEVDLADAPRLVGYALGANHGVALSPELAGAAELVFAGGKGKISAFRRGILNATENEDKVPGLCRQIG